MEQISWVIENLTGEESFKQLSEAAEKLGYPVLNLRGDYKRQLIAGYNNQPVIFNGSIEMAKLIGPQLLEQGCAPVLYSSWEKYLCTAYYPVLSEFLFNDNYVLVPLKEVEKRKFFFYGLFGRETTIFLRPNDGDKSFKGGLIDLQDFEKWYDPAMGNDLAIVSSPKNIRGEWRFICSRHKEIISQSCYRFGGLITRIPSAPVGATKKCQEILEAGYCPDSVFCVDIVEDNDGNYWLMELNSFSSAGLYASDKEKIAKRVSEIAQEDWIAHRALNMTKHLKDI